MKADEIQVGKCYLGSIPDGQFVIKVTDVKNLWPGKNRELEEDVVGDMIILNENMIACHQPSTVCNLTLYKEIDFDIFYSIQKKYQAAWLDIVLKINRELMPPEETDQ